MRFLVLTFVLIFSGCSSIEYPESDISKWLVPINAAVGYFGAVGLHEGGHALTASVFGARDVAVTVLPGQDDDNKQYLGRTTARFDNPSDLELTLFNVSGPTFMFMGHLWTRALLRTGQVPKLAQPTVAWFNIMNQIGYYGNIIAGLARIEHKDLGKEEVWISGVMLVGSLTIDLIDFFSDDPKRYFGVLIGENFYDENSGKNFSIIVAPMRGGGSLSIQFNW